AMTGDEALFNEADTAFSAVSANGAVGDVGGGYVSGSEGVSVGFGTTGGSQSSNPDTLNPSGQAGYKVGQGMDTDKSEALGTDSSPAFNEMAFSIEKVTVTAKSRALKAEYSLELAQDLKAIHGLNAEAELANILSTEILAEINREVIRTIYKVAKPGAQNNVATTGTFDLDIDSNGRWSVEKFKGLIFQMERDANAIAQETRRGKGNMIVCSADVASALTMAGVLDYTPALNANLNVDDTGNTFAGILQGKYRVYIDPYSVNANAASQYYVVGYKGSSPYDAGLFYCPYVPLQMVRAVGENTFQPKIGFKTRYGLVSNPFAEGTTAGLGRITANSNRYYR
ncbi:MAG: ATP-binding protein, partial [Pseudomonadota bacterium]|nr:ATP-binding protein [Pseudomonadota bacterium]